MAYILKFQLRDTKREFDTEVVRDKAYNTVLQQMLDWGIPEGNIELTKINNSTCDLGFHHETVVQ